MRFKSETDTLQAGEGTAGNGAGAPATVSEALFLNPAGDTVDPGEGLAEWNGLKDPLSAPAKDAEKPGLPAKPAEPAAPGKEAPPKETEKEGTDVPPAADAAAPGDEAKAAPETTDEDTISGILAKYKTKEALGKAFKHLQQWATGKDEEKKQVEKRLQEQADLVDRYLERDGESWRLRREAVADFVQSEHGKAPDTAIDERRFFLEEAQKLEAVFRDTIGDDPDAIRTALQKSVPQINERVRDRVAQARAALDSQRHETARRAAARVDAYFKENPEHKEYLPEIERWFKRIPAQVATQIVLNDWFPFAEIVSASRSRANFESAVREAYTKGVEVGSARHQKPESELPQTPGSRAPKRTGTEVDEVGFLKQSILNAGNLEPLEAIFRD